MSKPSSSHRSSKRIQLAALNTAAGGGVNTVDFPADVRKGDLAVFIQTGTGIIAAPSYVSPGGGFTDLFTAYGGGTWGGFAAHAMICAGTEGGTTITSTNAGNNNGKYVLIFRGNRPFTRFSFAPFTTELTDGNPVAQNIAGAGATSPCVALAIMASRNDVNPRTSSPTMLEVNADLKSYVLYHLFEGGFTDISVDMDDEGENMMLGSGLIQLYYAEDHAQTVAFQSSASSSSGTVSATSSLMPGDALFMFDRASNGSGIPSAVVDSGWEELAGVTGSPHRFSIFGKIADESDVSASLAGATGNTTNHHVFMSFRGERPFQKMTAFSPVSVAPVSSDPGDIVVVDQSLSKVRLHLALYCSSGAVSPRTMSPAADAEVTPATVFYAAYRMLQAGAALGNTTVGMADEGTGNTLLAVGVELI